jgi:hypothetical protein
MHDIIGPILEVLADAAPSAELPERPRWLRRGCAIISVLLLVAFVALIIWAR